MTLTYDKLDRKFRGKIEQLDQQCFDSGIEFRPFFVIRTPQQQGRLWRQSRSREQVMREIRNHRDLGCDFLADCIERCGSQHGKWATNATPGRSWHQWGLAVDSFYFRDGKADWETMEAYQRRAEFAKDLGLTAGYFFKGKAFDAVHIQAFPQSVINLYALQEVDAIMKERFGDAPW